MKLRLWLKRVKGFKIRGLHRRRFKNMHRSKPTAHMKNSPVFASGNLSLPSPQPENSCLSPVLHQKAPHHVTQRMFSPSLLSPSPFPAPTSTPTDHHPPLALKDLLGFEAVDRNTKPPNAFAHIAASLSCCQTESPRMDSSSHGALKGFAEYGEPNHLKNHKEQGRLHASTTKWTGICKCVLVRPEKQIVITNADARKLRGTQRASAWNLHMQRRNATGNEVAKSTNSMQASDSNACVDREDASSLRRANVHEKLTATKLPCGEHASVSTSGHLGARMALSRQTKSLVNDEISHGRGYPCSHISTSTRSLPLSDVLPNQQISLVKGRASASSSVSSIDKIHNWVSHDSKHAHRGAALVQEWAPHQEQVNFSGRLACNSVDCAVDDNKVRGLGSDEESSLLQADSYDSSDTFSISSHSPWLNEPKQVAPPSNVDLEAHARPWISTDDHVAVAKLHNKSALSRRRDAKALKRSCQEVFMQKTVSKMGIQPKTNTIVLPSEIIRANQELNSSSMHANYNADKSVRGGVQGSLAVEKRSHDPYVDFADSMLDMIVQNHMCSSKELEGLLQCFLSLNSLEHHDVIVQAFTEVWEKVVVGKTTPELRHVPVRSKQGA